MSSSRPPTDCGVQVPSWDEFDHSEELNYNSDSEHEIEEQNSRMSSRMIGPSLPPSDQLPSSFSEPAVGRFSADQNYGPSLPPAFTNGTEGDDPEDPGDPDDPDENDSRSDMPNMRLTPQHPVSMPSPSFSGSNILSVSINAGDGDSFSPSLPDEESKRTRGNDRSILPPPEPEPGDVNVNNLKQFMGPSVPDILPTDGDEEESYGPAVPFDLNSIPSGSKTHQADVEMPTEDDSCARENSAEVENEIFGPIPPWEQQELTGDRYEDRLSRFEAQKALKASSSGRPEWMTELPKKLGIFGLSGQKFSKGTSDPVAREEAVRIWTETPMEKAHRQSQNCESSSAGPSKIDCGMLRDKEDDKIQAEKAKVLNEGRVDSLLNLHQRKRKCDPTSNAKEDTSYRRPFDREKDMKDGGASSGELNADKIKERCGDLNSRFAPSSSRKFL